MASQLSVAMKENLLKCQMKKCLWRLEMAESNEEKEAGGAVYSTYISERSGISG